MTKNEISKNNEPKTMAGWLSQPDQQQRLVSFLKGSYLTPQEFTENVILAFSADPQIAQCSERSKFEVALELAALNLTPNWNHVALIPRKQRSGPPRLTFLVQYQGLKALIDRSELVKDTSVVLIHKSDAGKYSFDPAMRQVVWGSDFDPFEEDREFRNIDDVRGGYLVIKYTDGRPDKHVLVPRAAFVKARECAETKNVWDRFIEPQCHKTVYHYAWARREVPADSKVSGLMTRATEHEWEMMGSDPNRVTPQPPQRVGQSMADFDEDESIEVVEFKPRIEPPKPEPKPAKKKAVRKKAVKKQEPPVSDPEPSEDELLAAVTNSDMRMLTDANFSMFVSGIQMCRDRATLDVYIAQFDPETPELDVAMTEEIENHLKELANRALEAAE